MFSLFHSSILTYLGCFVCLNFWYHYIAPDTWPYIFFKDPDNIITGEDPILIRIRPEMGDSNFWMRIDLRLARNGAEILASPN